MVIAQPSHPKTAPITIRWKKLPDGYRLPDDPVDNVNQSNLATALTESLKLSGLMSESAFTMTHYDVCTTVYEQIVVKAPGKVVFL